MHFENEIAERLYMREARDTALGSSPEGGWRAYLFTRLPNDAADTAEHVILDEQGINLDGTPNLDTLVDYNVYDTEVECYEAWVKVLKAAAAGEPFPDMAG